MRRTHMRRAGIVAVFVLGFSLAGHAQLVELLQDELQCRALQTGIGNQS